MSYSALTVADYFLDRASSEARALTPMQLVKIAYIAHGWHLGYFDEPLIDEPVEAWEFGPIVDSIYRHTKRFGSNAVIGRLRAATVFGLRRPLSEPTKALLNAVWDSYKSFSGLDLSTMTHGPGSPWESACKRKGSSVYRHVQIDNVAIQRHYKEKIGRSQHAQG